MDLLYSNKVAVIVLSKKYEKNKPASSAGPDAGCLM